MALGGGTFVSQNKVLPGSYINIISTATADASLGDRGTVAMALDLDWGIDNEVFILTRADFQTKSRELLGYEYGHEKLRGLRDLFLNARELVAYKLTSGGKKAQNEYAVAKHGGVRGNDLMIQIQDVPGNAGEFVVTTLLGTSPVDEQVVTNANELVSNAFVDFQESFNLASNAGKPLTGGANGEIDGASHQAFLDKAESQMFNVIAAPTVDTPIINLYTAYTERLRDDQGKKFQAVLYNAPANYEGVINVKNEVLNDENKASLVYWVAGLEAAKGVNESALNDIYNGEFEADVEFTQTELEQAIKAGEFTLHLVGQDVRVLSDINSLVSITADKGKVFQDNQTVRIVDQIANDIAALFSNKYLGVVPNDQSGRVSLQADIVSHHQALQDIRAIEGFAEDDVTVVQGNDKKSVVVTDAITIVNTMEKLYMTVVVS